MLLFIEHLNYLASGETTVMQSFVAYCFSVWQEVIHFIFVASSFLPCVC